MNPADCRDTVSSTLRATVEESLSAIEASVAAWDNWRDVSLEDRRHIVQQLLTKVLDAGSRFAAAISSESGKTGREAQQEIAATLEEANVQLALFADPLSEQIGEHQVSFEPLGATLLITPSNFPLAALMRKLVPALLSGNTVVAKVSELTPLTSQLLFECIDTLGLAPGVANLVIADGRVVVRAMIEAPGLRAVSVTGSTATGKAIAEAIGARNIRLQAEMGGSNAVVVLADADLAAAIVAISEHGFACCGQWCTGTTRVFVEESVYDEVVTGLIDAAKKIVVGPGHNKESDMGAFTSPVQLQRVEEDIASLCRSGARLLFGGKRPDADLLQHGYFLEPTIIAGELCNDACLDREIFGPVIVVTKVANAAKALERSNASRYGFSFSVFTNDRVLAEEMIGKADAGMCHINLGTGVRDHRLPLSGWNQSGRGIPECGTYARDFFTRTKAIYRGPSR